MKKEDLILSMSVKDLCLVNKHNKRYSCESYSKKEECYQPNDHNFTIYKDMGLSDVLFYIRDKIIDLYFRNPIINFPGTLNTKCLYVNSERLKEWNFEIPEILQDHNIDGFLTDVEPKATNECLFYREGYYRFPLKYEKDSYLIVKVLLTYVPHSDNYSLRNQMLFTKKNRLYCYVIKPLYDPLHGLIHCDEIPYVFIGLNPRDNSLMFAHKDDLSSKKSKIYISCTYEDPEANQYCVKGNLMYHFRGRLYGLKDKNKDDKVLELLSETSKESLESRTTQSIKEILSELHNIKKS